MVKFAADLGEATDIDKLLQKHPNCTVDRCELERRLLISHAFMSKYLPQMSAQSAVANPELADSQPQSFYKFLCPLCLKLIYRCVTTVCGHSFCEMCLDEYLLVKPVRCRF
jgi:hypothetical protein